jgi:hypothetical protein
VSKRQPRRSRSSSLIWAAVIIVILAALLFVGSRRNVESGARAPAQPTQAAAPAQTAPADTAKPSATGIVVPTPAIPLPRGCPANTAPQVDNPGLYGFCTPVGWGAYNDNNSTALTLVMKPRPGGSPVLLPSDVDRIQLLIALNGPSQPQTPPGCGGPPNDSIDGVATHHCTADINPNNNPYRASRAEFWMIDLFGGKQFNITALIADDVDPDDIALMNQVVHSVKPPATG